MMTAYLLRGLDQGAISYVKTMNPHSSRNILSQLSMTDNGFSYASTVFTLFYALGELPSNLLVKKVTPRWHYLRIIGLWSIAAACQAAAKGEAGLLVARSFLGLFEAGLAPGLYLHLTFWYRPDEIGVRIASISALYQFANIFTAFLTYGLSFANGRGGVSGWQWVFIVNGLLCFPIGLAVWIWMPNYPDTANFLTNEERAWVVGRLPSSSSRAVDSSFSSLELKRELRDITNYVFAITLMFYQSGLLGYLFWLPTIIAGFGISATATVQLLNIPPAFLYWVGGTCGAYMNDRATGVPRVFMFCIACSLWVAGLFCLAFVKSKAGLYAIVCIVSVPAAWGFNAFLPWRVQTIRGSTSAAFIMAFMNGSGQIPGLWSAQIFRSQYKPRYTVPFMILVALTLVSMVLSFACWYLTYDTEKETRRINALRRAKGKNENVVIDEDFEIDENVSNAVIFGQENT
ncbi:MAG: hypothetical protein CYPHOPRED_002341 [Cyphobasidiales sp. Tagirdzhanova-0007]|nr:MAG: hypothetical protein CYPHOPRED_002341 [Cyphobasidiales sp. Tagirdzhanova-0007]